jgi:hypothetical protein
MGSASELGFGSPYLHECDPDERALGFGAMPGGGFFDVVLGGGGRVALATEPAVVMFTTNAPSKIAVHTR